MPQAAPSRLAGLLAAALTLALVLASAALAAPAPRAPAAVPVAGAVADSLRPAADSSAAPAVDHLAEIRAGFTPRNRAYSNLHLDLALLEPFYAIAVALLVLFTGLSARIRDLAHALSPKRYWRVLVYLTVYSALAFVLEFPLDWYGGFQLEHLYKMSNQSFGGWLGEELIGLGVSIVALGVVPLVALAYRALERQPRRWWLWLACGTLPVVIAAVLVSPYVEKLTNKFQPLRDQTLKREILSLAERAGIPGRKVFEVDKSRQTNKYNAYVTGFGVSQRIVLWDTTLKGMKRDEILCVMGHEMGHYVLHHIWKGMALTVVFAFGLFWLVARILEPLVARFGTRWGVPSLHDVASMPLLAATLTLVSFLAQPVMNGYSRTVEHEADVFGLELTHDNDAMARAFIKLGSQNRSDPEPPAWRVWLQFSHPPLAERVRFAMTYRPWETGQPNRAYHGADAGATPPGR